MDYKYKVSPLFMTWVSSEATKRANYVELVFARGFTRADIDITEIKSYIQIFITC